MPLCDEDLSAFTGTVLATVVYGGRTPDISWQTLSAFQSNLTTECSISVSKIKDVTFKFFA